MQLEATPAKGKGTVQIIITSIKYAVTPKPLTSQNSKSALFRHAARRPQ